MKQTRIKNLMIELGTTQKELAELTGLTEKRINDYCNGADIPKKRCVVIVGYLNMIRIAKGKALKGRIRLEDLLIHNVLNE